MASSPARRTAVFGRSAARSPSTFPRTAVSGATARSASRIAASPTSPAWMICSQPRSASSASERRSPCVSEMTPIRICLIREAALEVEAVILARRGIAVGQRASIAEEREPAATAAAAMPHVGILAAVPDAAAVGKGEETDMRRQKDRRAEEAEPRLGVAPERGVPLEARDREGPKRVVGLAERALAHRAAADLGRLVERILAPELLSAAPERDREAAARGDVRVHVAVHLAERLVRVESLGVDRAPCGQHESFPRKRGVVAAVEHRLGVRAQRREVAVAVGLSQEDEGGIILRLVLPDLVLLEDGADLERGVLPEQCVVTRIGEELDGAHAAPVPLEVPGPVAEPVEAKHVDARRVRAEGPEVAPILAAEFPEVLRLAAVAPERPAGAQHVARAVRVLAERVGAMVEREPDEKAEI